MNLVQIKLENPIGIQSNWNPVRLESSLSPNLHLTLSLTPACSACAVDMAQLVKSFNLYLQYPSI